MKMNNVIENEIGDIVNNILEDYKKDRSIDKMDLFNLNKQIAIVLKYCREFEGKNSKEIQVEAERISIAFFNKIPYIREYVDTDLYKRICGYRFEGCF